MQCPQCKRDFPEDLILDMNIGKRIQTCPICQRQIRNKVHDLPRAAAFTGASALTRYNAAIAHLEATGQNADQFPSVAHLFPSEATETPAASPVAAVPAASPSAAPTETAPAVPAAPAPVQEAPAPAQEQAPAPAEDKPKA